MRIGNYDLDFVGNCLTSVKHEDVAWIKDATNRLIRCGLVEGDQLCWDEDVTLAINQSADESSRLKAELNVEEHDGHLVLNLALTNQTQMPIGSVEFPCLGGIQIPKGTRMTWPLMAGAEIELEELAPDETLQMGYPVYASMQWLDMYRTDGRGLYLGMHDAAPHTKFLHAGRKGGSGWMSCEWFGVMIQPGERFVFPPVVLATHDRAWYGAADIYRQWVMPQIKRWQAPRWIADEPTTVLTVLKESRAPEPTLTFADLPHLAECARQAGAYTLHLVGYMEDGHDTDYPQFVPGECMGGSEGLSDAGRKVRDASVELAFYSNGRLMDSTWSDQEQIYAFAVKRSLWIFERILGMWDHMIRPEETTWDPRSCFVTENPSWNHDGRGATEGWWADIFAVCCPGSKPWRETLTGYLESLAKNYHPKLLQIDQVCGCWSWPCMDESHDHHRPSLAWACYRPFIRTLRERLRAINPDLAVWSEGVNDLLGESFDALQTNSHFKGLLRGHGRWEPALYQYTCPGQLMLANSMNNQSYEELNLILVSRGFFFLGHQSFLTWDENANEPFNRYLTFALNLRKKYADIYTDGQLLALDEPAPIGLHVMVHALGHQRLLIASPSVELKCMPDQSYEFDLPHYDCLSDTKLVTQDKFNDDDADAQIFDGRIRWQGRGVLCLLWISKCKSMTRCFTKHHC